MTGDSVYNGFRGYGQAEQCVPSDAVPPTIGSRLPIVVKPDFRRRDACRPRSAGILRPVVEMAASWQAPAYVVLRADGRQVKLPVHGVGYDGHELHIYAEAGE